jgi:hypothetical protein
MRLRPALVAACLLLPACAATAQQPTVVRRVAPEGATPPGPEGQQVVVRRSAPPAQRIGEHADVAMTTQGIPTITAMVNGKGPFRFGVDTGASGYLVVKPDVAQTIGLAIVGEAMAADPSGRNPVPVHLYQADSVSFGDLTYKGVSASSISIGGPMAELDGIVGIAFFRDLLVTLDFGRGRLTAQAGALPPPNDRDVVAATIEPSGLFSLPLRIGDKLEMVHLDTGNGRQALFLPQADMAGLPVSGEPRELGVARTVSQEIHIMGADLAVPVTIGTTRLPITQVAYPSVTVGNLGSAGLQGLAVTLDAVNGRVRVVASEGAGIAPGTQG